MLPVVKIEIICFKENDAVIRRGNHNRRECGRKILMNGRKTDAMSREEVLEWFLEKDIKSAPYRSV